jgi:hypothetical protein
MADTPANGRKPDRITMEDPDFDPAWLPDGPVKVPLTIYIGEERRIIGEAVVTGNKVEAYIVPADGDVLPRLVNDGTVQNVSVSFNEPPATPIVDDNGHIRWRKDY